MASNTSAQTVSHHKQLTVESALDKLLDTANIIKLRDGVKPVEGKRIEDAFSLLAGKSRRASSQSAKRQEIYLEYLRKVERTLGLSMVILSAAGLGQSAISTMKDRVRVELPSQMKKREKDLNSSILQNLANNYSAKFFPNVHHDAVSITQEQSDGAEEGTEKSLTGDVYQLTPEDAQNVIQSDHIQGEIWLTITYNPNASPFVTIPISRKLSDRFATQRPQMM